MVEQQPATELSYIDAGASDAPGLVLLHGLGSCAEDWHPQVEHFAASHHVIAVDLRGHGRSAAVGVPESMEQMADDVARLVRRLGLRNAHYVGLSLGGMVGLQCAVSNPAPMASLTLVNSTPHARPDTWALRTAFAARRLLVRYLGLARTGEIIGRKLFPKPEQHALRRQFVDRVARNDKAAYLGAVQAISRWSVRDALPWLSLPVLVVSGDRDYSTVEQKQDWMRALPHARLEVIADSGHATPLDQPVRFNQALERFLQSVEQHSGEGRNHE